MNKVGLYIKDTIKIIIIGFILFIDFSVYSQTFDTLYLKMNGREMISSPCNPMLCIDSIYQQKDTLFVVFHDNSVVIEEITIGGKVEGFTISFPFYVITNFKNKKPHVLPIMIERCDIKKCNILVIKYIDYSYYFQRHKRTKNMFKYKNTNLGGEYINNKVSKKRFE